MSTPPKSTRPSTTSNGAFGSAVDAGAVVDAAEDADGLRDRAHAFAHANVHAAEQAEHRDVVVSAVKLASVKSSSVPPKMLMMRITRGTCQAPLRCVAREHVDDVLGFVAAVRGRRLHADAELGLFLRRVLTVRLEVEVVRELEQPLVRLGIERFVEPPLEGLARELAVAVIHDELIDRLLAQRVDRTVVWCHWHRSPR